MELKAFYFMYLNEKALGPEKRAAREALFSGMGILVFLTLAAGAMAQRLNVSELFIVKCLGVFVVIFLVVFTQLTKHHPRPRFGTANQITLTRAGLVAFLCGFVGESSTQLLLWYAVMIALLGTSLDALDGWLARREGMVSPLGARFDMEIDASHILILAVLAFQSGKAGIWVLTAGALRYLFVIVGYFITWLASELPPSRRRQSVCVLQIISLITCLSPAVPAPCSGWIAAFGVLLLTASFGIDICQLARAHYYRSQRRMN